MNKPEIDFLVEYDDASILRELRRVATATGSDTVTKADLSRLGRVSHSEGPGESVIGGPNSAIVRDLSGPDRVCAEGDDE